MDVFLLLISLIIFVRQGNGCEFCLVLTQKAKKKSIFAFIKYFLVVVLQDYFSVVS